MLLLLFKRWPIMSLHELLQWMDMIDLVKLSSLCRKIRVTIYKNGNHLHAWMAVNGLELLKTEKVTSVRECMRIYLVATFLASLRAAPKWPLDYGKDL